MDSLQESFPRRLFFCGFSSGIFATLAVVSLARGEWIGGVFVFGAAMLMGAGWLITALDWKRG